VNYKGTRRF